MPRLPAVRKDRPHSGAFQQIRPHCSESQQLFAENRRGEGTQSSQRRFPATPVLTAPIPSNAWPHSGHSQQAHPFRGTFEHRAAALAMLGVDAALAFRNLSTTLWKKDRINSRKLVLLDIRFAWNAKWHNENAKSHDIDELRICTKLSKCCEICESWLQGDSKKMQAPIVAAGIV